MEIVPTRQQDQTSPPPPQVGTRTPFWNNPFAHGSRACGKRTAVSPARLRARLAASGALVGRPLPLITEGGVAPRVRRQPGKLPAAPVPNIGLPSFYSEIFSV